MKLSILFQLCLSGRYLVTALPSSPPSIIHVPAVHGSVNRSDVNNLLTDTAVNLFYAEQAPSTSSTLSVANIVITELAYPAVVLEYSNAISSLSCSADTLTITFNSNVAYDTAWTDWTKLPEFVLITYSPNCGEAASTGARDYILVSSVSFNKSTLSATASITPISFQRLVSATNKVTVASGYFTPVRSNSTEGGFAAGFSPVSGDFVGTLASSANSTSSTDSTTDFDVALDEAIGFLDTDNSTLWTQLFPGVIGETTSALAGEQDGPSLVADTEKRQTHARRNIEKRSFFDWFEDVVNTVVDAITTVAESAAQLAERLAAAIVEDVHQELDAELEEIVIQFDAVNPYTPNTYTPLSATYGFTTGPGIINTTWGLATKLFSESVGTGSVVIYCVGCGVQGSLAVQSTVTFSIAEGIISGDISVVGPISTAVQLGVVASLTQTWDYSAELANIPLSPLQIPGIITIDPEITLSAGGSLTVNTVGQFFGGVILNWTDISASLDIVNAGNSGASGFSPSVRSKFAAQGSISSMANLFLTVSLEFGINILPGNISTTIALIEQPQLSLTAAASGQVSSSGTTANCTGVEFTALFTNSVYADIPGSTDININTLVDPQISTCVSIPQKRSLFRKRQDGEIISVNPNDESPISPSYSVLDSLDGVLELHYADNGNLYVVTSNSTTEEGVDDTILFATLNTTIIGDSEGRIFHGYADTLEELGVSRFRLADIDEIPNTSVILFLIPVNINDTTTVVMASDSAGNFYYPIICVYDSLRPKIFLATDPEAGAAILEDTTYIPTLTGGQVNNCTYFPFTSGLV